MDKPIPPLEVREKHLAGLQKTRAEIQEGITMADKLIAHLDAQIAAQPQRTRQSIQSTQD